MWLRPADTHQGDGGQRFFVLDSLVSIDSCRMKSSRGRAWFTCTEVCGAAVQNTAAKCTEGLGVSWHPAVLPAAWQAFGLPVRDLQRSTCLESSQI